MLTPCKTRRSFFKEQVQGQFPPFDCQTWVKNEKMVVEIKKTRTGLKTKEVGEQLLIDIQKYKVHQDCKTLFCFVYDPEGRIANPVGLENDLTSIQNDLSVYVTIEPK